MRVHGLQDGDLHYRRCLVWCPGCDDIHAMNIEGEDKPTPCWDWDGSRTKPTFEPSILVQFIDKHCHSYLRAGVWEFLGDSTHSLAGQKVKMVPIPDWLKKH